MGSLSHAEQNRLVIENSNLTSVIAAFYRGAKSIPFEDLEAQAGLGLVIAARRWRQLGDFQDFAARCMHNQLKEFIRTWQELSPVGDEPEIERYYFEWTIWPFAAPYECWTSVAATPEEIIAAYDEVSRDSKALASALLGLDRRARQIMDARFFRNPNQTLESIAREHKISFQRVAEIVKSSIASIQDNIKAQKQKSARVRLSDIPPTRVAATAN